MEWIESLINKTEVLHLRLGKKGGWQEMWHGKPMQPRHTGKGARCVEVWKSSSRARNPFLKQHTTQETVVILWCWCMESWMACCNVDFSILFRYCQVFSRASSWIHSNVSSINGSPFDRLGTNIISLKKLYLPKTTTWTVSSHSPCNSHTGTIRSWSYISFQAT